MDMNHGKGMAGRILASGASPVRKLGKASRRLTAWLLALVVLCGMVPARSVEASEVRKGTASEDVSAAGAPTGAAKRTFAVRSTSGGLDPYAVTLRWKGGDVHCKLDEDGTTAEWTFDDTSERLRLRPGPIRMEDMWYVRMAGVEPGGSGGMRTDRR